MRFKSFSLGVNWNGIWGVLKTLELDRCCWKLPTHWRMTRKSRERLITSDGRTHQCVLYKTQREPGRWLWTPAGFTKEWHQIAALVPDVVLWLQPINSLGCVVWGHESGKCVLFHPSQKDRPGISLVVQWLRTRLAIQGMLVRSLVGELRSHIPQIDPAHEPQLSLGATK